MYIMFNGVYRDEVDDFHNPCLSNPMHSVFRLDAFDRPFEDWEKKHQTLGSVQRDSHTSSLSRTENHLHSTALKIIDGLLPLHRAFQ